MVGRFWTYSQWDGKRLLHSSDEYGRRTVLVQPRKRAFVFAYRTCRCEFCAMAREQTAADDA